MPTEPDCGLLNAFSSTLVAMENLVTLTEGVCARLHEHLPADDAELRHVEEQVAVAREQLPKMKGYLAGLQTEIRIH